MSNRKRKRTARILFFIDESLFTYDSSNFEMKDEIHNQADLIRQLKNTLRSKKDWYEWLQKHCKYHSINCNNNLQAVAFFPLRLMLNEFLTQVRKGQEETSLRHRSCLNECYRFSKFTFKKALTLISDYVQLRVYVQEEWFTAKRGSR